MAATITKKLSVDGMSCKHCAERVEKALGEITGVVKAEVILDEGHAKVILENNISDSVFSTAIIDAGYEFKGVVV